MNIITNKEKQPKKHQDNKLESFGVGFLTIEIAFFLIERTIKFNKILRNFY
jgi:hypothetical protein